MGEEFIRKLAARSRTSNDAAYEREVNSNRLFASKPHIFETRFRCCLCAPGIPIRNGDPLLIKESNEPTLDVVRGNTKIATIDGDQAMQLRDALRAERRAVGWMSATVVRETKIGNYFTVAVTGEGNAT